MTTRGSEADARGTEGADTPPLRPIASRIRRFLILLTTAAVLFFLGMVWIIQRNLEITMLNAEYEQEKTLFFRNLNLERHTVWQAQNNTFAFLLPHESREFLPEYLRDRPPGFKEEIEVGSTTYLVNVEQINGGTLYVAKDISHFENGVRFYFTLISAFAVLIILLGIFISGRLSRQIARPLVRLADMINEQQVRSQLKPLQVDFKDRELYAIARSMNRFIKKINDYNRREKDLLRMASHELKTPLAVTMGGFDILQRRGTLSVKDDITMQRMHAACQEMQRNTEMILKLSRAEEDDDAVLQCVDLLEVLKEVREDCRQVMPEAVARLSLPQDEPAAQMVETRAALLKMLLRNLIHNALQHTPGQVSVEVLQPMPSDTLAANEAASALSSMVVVQISDQGSGFSAAQRDLLNAWWHEGDSEAFNGSVSGLGLYIATLVSERLHVRMRLHATAHGNLIRVGIPPRLSN